MTSQDGPISFPPTRTIEDCLVALLQADPALAGLTIVAGSDRDAAVPPLHCFVLCPTVTPVLSVGQNYFADVVIVVASNIDDNVDAERKEWFSRVLTALTRTEPGYAIRHARLLHWSIDSIRETSAGQNTGDRLDLRVAAWVAAGS